MTGTQKQKKLKVNGQEVDWSVSAIYLGYELRQQPKKKNGEVWEGQGSVSKLKQVLARFHWMVKKGKVAPVYGRSFILTYLIPKMTYGWSFYEPSNEQRVIMNQAMKIALGVHRSTNNMMTHCMIGLPEIHVIAAEKYIAGLVRTLCCREPYVRDSLIAVLNVEGSRTVVMLERALKSLKISPDEFWKCLEQLMDEELPEEEVLIEEKKRVKKLVATAKWERGRETWELGFSARPYNVASKLEKPRITIGTEELLKNSVPFGLKHLGEKAKVAVKWYLGRINATFSEKGAAAKKDEHWPQVCVFCGVEGGDNPEHYLHCYQMEDELKKEREAIVEYFGKDKRVLLDGTTGWSAFWKESIKLKLEELEAVRSEELRKGIAWRIVKWQDNVMTFRWEVVQRWFCDQKSNDVQV